MSQTIRAWERYVAQARLRHLARAMAAGRERVGLGGHLLGALGQGIRGLRKTIRAARRLPRYAIVRLRRDNARGDGTAVRTVDWHNRVPWIADYNQMFTEELWRPEPDVLHIHDISLLEAGVAAARTLKEQGHRTRLIYDAHEYIPGILSSNPETAAAWQAMEADLIDEVDAIITVSEPIAEAIQAHYHLDHRPVVVLNAPALTDQRPATTGIRETSRVAASAPLLVYSGNLGLKRGLYTVIDALMFVADVHLAIVCVPNPRTVAALKLQEYADTAGVGDRVHLVEPVHTQKIIDYLSSADIGVHPMVGGLLNHELALPNKLFDYIFAGLPVVVTDLQMMGRFVRERGLGETFRPGDPVDLARAIRTTLANHETHRRNATDPQLRSQFSWEVQAEQLRDLYLRLQQD